jgi:hypothetical protein
MAPHIWPAETTFRTVELVAEDRHCPSCQRWMTICDHRHRRLFTLEGPVHLVCKLVHCPEPTCRSRPRTFASWAEPAIAPPFWTIGWDVFAWIGHRRFARHWSVPQLRAELTDRFQIELSDDAIEDYLARYQAMMAARHQDPAQLAAAYAGVEDLVLTIDGLQPEKGHETLYVVRELRARRVWFAEALLSSAGPEIEPLLVRAREIAARLGTPVRAWMTDKQPAFVTGLAKVFPGVPHRYCRNHFLHELAQPVLDMDRHAKVQMRKKVRGLRAIEREVLARRAPAAAPTMGDVVLDYCVAVRGILNNDQSGPLDPPGLRMAGALDEVLASLGRCLAAQKGAQTRPC